MSRRVVAPARSPAAELEQLGLQCQQLRLTRVAQKLPSTNTARRSLAGSRSSIPM